MGFRPDVAIAFQTLFVIFFLFVSDTSRAWVYIGEKRIYMKHISFTSLSCHIMQNRIEPQGEKGYKKVRNTQMAYSGSLEFLSVQEDPLLLTRLGSRSL